MLAAEQIVRQAREAAALEHARMLADLKQEVGRLVTQTTAAVIGKVLTPDDHRRLAEETARHWSAQLVVRRGRAAMRTTRQAQREAKRAVPSLPGGWSARRGSGASGGATHGRRRPSGRPERPVALPTAGEARWRRAPRARGKRHAAGGGQPRPTSKRGSCTSTAVTSSPLLPATRISLAGCESGLAATSTTAA